MGNVCPVCSFFFLTDACSEGPCFSEVLCFGDPAAHSSPLPRFVHLNLSDLGLWSRYDVLQDLFWLPISLLLYPRPCQQIHSASQSAFLLFHPLHMFRELYAVSEQPGAFLLPAEFPVAGGAEECGRWWRSRGQCADKQHGGDKGEADECRRMRSDVGSLL